MKFLLKLLKPWSHEGNEFAAGQQIEIDDKTMAGQLVMDGIAERVEKSTVAAQPNQKDIEAVVNKAVEAGLKNVAEKVATETTERVNAIRLKDLSDEDPFHGFLPGYNGKPLSQVSKAEKMFALGNFAKQLHESGPEMVHASELIKKSRERSRNMIQKASDITVAADDQAGVLVPPEISNTMFAVAAETAVIDPLCSHMSISSNRIEFPKIKDYDRSSGLVFGGVKAYWKGEDAQLTSSGFKTEEVGINLHALTALAYTSDQALKFASVDLGSYLLQTMGAAITYKRESVFLTGTGSGMPLGVLNAPCALSVAAEGSQTTDTIVVKNLWKMEAALRARGQGSVAWIYNRIASLAQLRGLSLTIGTGGVQIPAFQGNPLSNDATLDGIPIHHSEHAKALGELGDIVLVDWSDYLVVDHRSGQEIASSIHLKFDYAQTAYRIMSYVGGQPLSSQAYTDTNSKQSSPVVLLAAR